jgi:hypothetical protein
MSAVAKVIAIVFASDAAALRGDWLPRLGIGSSKVRR